MVLRRVLPGLAGLCSLAYLAGCDAGSSGEGPAAPSAPAQARGCTVDADSSTPPVAPGGYYTNYSTVCTADGQPHLFRGVDRPSLEWDPKGETNKSEGIPASDFQAMATWRANVVRIALNQDFWLSGAALQDPNYPATVDRAVHDAEAAGLDVILDLHWSDQGNSGVSLLKTQDSATNSNQQPMADLNSQRFWIEVAQKYRGDGHVLFELYNEPHGISWQLWLNGGMYQGYQVVGMQQLYAAVRATGANNVVIAGGLSYAFDLSGVASNPVQGYNIMYATHPYDPQDPKARWEASFGHLATLDRAPVIATEFGDGTENCTGDWNTELIQFNDAHHISWTAWGWWAAGCSFPALISDWSYTPTAQGQVVKSALLGYSPQPGTPNVGGGGAGGGGAAGTDGAGRGGAAGTGAGGGGAAGTGGAGRSADAGGAGSGAAEAGVAGSAP